MTGKVFFTMPKGMWFSVVILLFIGLILIPLTARLPDSKPTSWSGFWPLFLVSQIYTYAGARIVVLGLLHRIEMDDSGVSWHTIKGKRSAAWSEITDYYEKRLSWKNMLVPNAAAETSTRLRELWVETTQGTFLIAPDLKGDFAAFREQVRQTAVNARSHEWELPGTRICDTWPRVFHYEPKKRRVIASVCCLAVVAYAATMPSVLWRLCGRLYASLSSDEVHHLYQMLWLIAIWPIVVFVLNGVLHLYTLRHAREQIVVTPQGFEYHGANNQRLAGDWSSVLDYYVMPTGLCGHRSVVALKGSDEKSFAFTTEIKASSDLHYIIKRYAPAPQSAALEGALWPVKNEGLPFAGLGGQLYHYRNRNNRSVLIIGTGVCALFPLLILLSYLLGTSAHSKGDPGPIIDLFMVLMLGMAYGWWRYFEGGIEIDDFWITQRTLFGQRRIAWISITDYKSVGDPYIVRGQKGAPIAFWASISRFEELKAEIERRAPSPQTGWKKLPAEKR